MRSSRSEQREFKGGCRGVGCCVSCCWVGVAQGLCVAHCGSRFSPLSLGRRLGLHAHSRPRCTDHVRHANGWAGVFLVVAAGRWYVVQQIRAHIR